MFTGLITDIGTIQRIARGAGHGAFTVRTGFDTATLELGESIAVDGTCLTVTEIGADSFAVEVSPETLRRTTLGERAQGDRVHLERALRVGDRLGGHMVQGHVDGVGQLVGRRREGNAWLLEFDAPEEVARYLVEKGSIAIDGVSLTVNYVHTPPGTVQSGGGGRFGVAIIPHTVDKTNLGAYRVGRNVNLEADMVGKYVEKFTQRAAASSTTSPGGAPGRAPGTASLF